MDELLMDLDKDGILTLILNRPDKLNALNRDLLEAIDEANMRAEKDAQVKGLLLTGTGKAFCAGADIQQLAACDTLKGYEFACYGQKVFSRMENLKKPSLALINGAALGGGCELAMAATLRLASDNAKFGQPEVKLGVIPGYGGTQRLARLVGKGRALDLCLTGRMIDATTAYHWGLVCEVVKPDSLLEIGRAMLLQILQLAPVAVSSIIEVIHSGMDMSLNDALKFEALHFAKSCSTKDKTEGVQAFLEKRSANFVGA